MNALQKAKRLYRNFREAEPTRVKRVTVSLPRALAVVGRVSAIEYDTTHGGSLKLYRHVFAAGSRPLLAAGPSDGQLYLLKGRFRVTARGIVDLDSKRRELK